MKVRRYTISESRDSLSLDTGVLTLGEGMVRSRFFTRRGVNREWDRRVEARRQHNALWGYFQEECPGVPYHVWLSARRMYPEMLALLPRQKR